jgi:hypothetical protein
MEWKHTYLTGTQFIWHLDDNPSEFSEAKMYKCNVPMIQVDENGWMLKCNRLLNNAINAIENGDVKQY